MQIYFLSIVYLLLGAGILLSDAYGGKYALLLSLRYVFRTNRGFRLALIITGFALSLALGFFPVAPGPRLLGDLIPLGNTLLLTFWYIYHGLTHTGWQKPPPEKSVVETTGKYVEKNKRNLGFITAVVALLHFLVPISVLL